VGLEPHTGQRRSRWSDGKSLSGQVSIKYNYNITMYLSLYESITARNSITA